MYQIEWTYGQCTLGGYLVAWRDDAIVWVAFGELSEDAVSALAQSFPDATLAEVAVSVRSTELCALNEYLDGSDGAVRPALAFEGTEFQREVWSALIEIPWGETQTYGALAQALGRHNAARAIGAACGANKIAVLVPCHRVLGESGSLRGFRWGEDLKRKLLEREASQQALF